MTCEKCDGTGYRIIERNGIEAAAPCECRPKKREEQRTPIDDRALAQQTELLFDTLDYVPKTDRARDALREDIRAMCGSVEALAWMVAMARRLHTKWNKCGLPGLRQILIKKYDPQDGLNLPAFSEDYPDAEQFDSLFGPPTGAYDAPALPDGATRAQIEAHRKTADAGSSGLLSVFSEAEARDIINRASAKPWAAKRNGPNLRREETARIEQEIAETRAKQQATLAKRAAAKAEGGGE